MDRPRVDPPLVWLGQVPLDVEVADSRLLDRVLADVASVERALAGLRTRVADRARALCEAGKGRPVEEVLQGKGELPAHEGRKATARAEATAKIGAATAAAARDGGMNPHNADTLARQTQDLDDAQVAQLQAADAEIAAESMRLTPVAFGRALAKRIRAIKGDDGLNDAERQRNDSGFRGSLDTRTGMWKFSLALDPVRGEAFKNAVESLTKAMVNEESNTGQPIPISDWWRATALHDAIVHRPGEGAGDGRTRARVEIVLIADARTATQGPHADSVRETMAGVPVAQHTLRRLACDATFRDVHIADDGLPLSVGRRHRNVTPAQARALRSMYRGCPISGVRFDRCEIHHLVEWRHGGRTDLDNLLPLSKRWHHLVHEGGWRITMHPDRSLDVYRPDGAHDRHIPPPEPLGPSM